MSNKYDKILGEYRENDAQDLSAYLTLDQTTPQTITGSPQITDVAYGASWNGSTLLPTRNAVYDKIESLPADIVSATFFGGL